MDFDLIVTLFLLLGLELVLGVDNVLVIAILVQRLPESMQGRARFFGLALAMGARIGLLFFTLFLARLDENAVLFDLTIRDLVLILGGLFLLYKAVKEIHHVVELKDENPVRGGSAAASFRAVITQIVLLDMVFSVDSVLTAIGLTRELWVIVTAVILSFVVILFFAKPIGDFILTHPALKILALAFLVTIGVTIFMEGMGQHVPKTYIYLPMGFALCIELLQMRYSHNRKRHGEPDPEG